MADEWNPNTPDMNNFNQKNETEELETKPVDTATLDRLRAERARLELEKHLTPGGITEQTVHTNLNEERETEINHIKERLGSYQDKARDDFNMTQQVQDRKEIEEDEDISF